MNGLRILITNNTLANRAGSELYVRDLALGLLQRGHTPIAYSRHLGEVARELRAATVPVIDDLNTLAVPPDVIHGQHHLEAVTALLHFPDVPTLYFCHGWLPWEEAPPCLPQIRRYLAVDYTCRDQLLYEHGIAAERVRVLLNFVDLNRFLPRGPLPTRPLRALIFSNNATEATYVKPVRAACEQAGIALNVIGLAAGTACVQPEQVLGQYDLVFAKGRAALEALAVGAAVVLCDARGVGPMVTMGELERLRPLNFGIRTLRQPFTTEVLMREIARYDAQDAAAVTRHIRATAGREAVVEELLALYSELIAEQPAARDAQAEWRALAAYLRWLALRLDEGNQWRGERDRLRADCARLEGQLALQLDEGNQWRVERDRLRADCTRLEEELARLSGSPLFHLHSRLLHNQMFTKLYRTLLRLRHNSAASE
jgi:hypothetical protein